MVEVGVYHCPCGFPTLEPGTVCAACTACRDDGHPYGCRCRPVGRWGRQSRHTSTLELFDFSQTPPVRDMFEGVIKSEDFYEIFRRTVKRVLDQPARGNPPLGEVGPHTADAIARNETMRALYGGLWYECSYCGDRFLGPLGIVSRTGESGSLYVSCPDCCAALRDPGRVKRCSGCGRPVAFRVGRVPSGAIRCRECM